MRISFWIREIMRNRASATRKCCGVPLPPGIALHNPLGLMQSDTLVLTVPKAQWGPYQFSRRGLAWEEEGATALLGRLGDSLTDIHDTCTTGAHSCECPAKRIGSLGRFNVAAIPKCPARGLQWATLEKHFPTAFYVLTIELYLILVRVLGSLDTTYPDFAI